MNDSPTTSNSAPAWMKWTGWTCTGLSGLGLLFSASMKLAQRPEALDGLSKLGYKQHALLGLGVLELVCTILYLIPQTAFFGAILLAGYLGGAMASHVRLSEPVVPHVILGVMIWLGLYFRDARLRELISNRMKSPN